MTEPLYEIEDSDIEATPGVTLRTSGRIHQLQDLLVPEWLEVAIDQGDDPVVRSRVELRDGMVSVTELHIESRPGQRSIKQSDIREIELAALVDLLAGFSLLRRPSEGVIEFVVPHPDGDVYDEMVKTLRRARSARVVTPDLLERVAEVYRANIDNAPTTAVRRAFLVGERQASSYVRRCRDAGLLPPTTPGKKRG